MIIGFDFDDTIIDTKKEKYKIMEGIFEKIYGSKKGVKKAYKAYASEPTSDKKTAKIFRQVLKRKPTAKEIKTIRKEFSKGYRKKLASCPLYITASFLKQLRKKMFILSLEDQRDVRFMAGHCKIAKYFDEIRGGPATKQEHFRALSKKYKEIIFIGDSRSDMRIAKKFAIKSIGFSIRPQKRKELKKTGADAVVASIQGLKKELKF